MSPAAASSRAGRALAAWIGWTHGHPRAVLGALALLTGIAIWAAAGLKVDTDSSRMLDPELPFQARAQAVNVAFPGLKNTVVLAVRGPRADPVEAAAAALAERLAADPAVAEVYAPSADPFFAAHGLLYLSEAALEARLTQLSKSANLLATLREDQTLAGFLGAVDGARRLAEEGPGAEALAPLYAEAAEVLAAARAGEARSFAWSAAFGEGGPVLRLVTLTPRLDHSRLSPAKPAIQAAEAAIAALPEALAAEVEIGLTGDPVLRAEELESVTATLGLSLALSLALVALVLRWALGSLGRMGLALGALGLTLVLTAGAAAAAVGALNLISVAFVVLMVGLGIDFAIHLMAHIEEDAAARPVPEAMAASGRALGPALALTAATTAAAFLAFATTEFVGMAQLGLIGAMGVLIAFTVAVTLIPAVLAIRPGLARRDPPPRPLPVLAPGRWGAGAALAAGVAALAIAPSARFDADPMSLRSPDAPSVTVMGWLAEDPARAPLSMSLLTGSAEAAEAAAMRIAARAEVGSARWLGDFVPEDQAAKLALLDLAWPSLDYAVSGAPVALTEAAPPGPAALAEALGADGAAGDLARELRALAAAADPALTARAEAALFRHFPALMDRLAAQLEADEVTLDALPAPLTERFRAGDLWRVEIRAAQPITEPGPRAAFVAAVAEAEPEAGGPPAQIVGASNAVAGAMLMATGLALAATALLAFAALRRVRPVLAVMAPVALAGAVTAAATVLLGMPFNYANVIVLPLLIGLGVDAGVHLALRAERSARLAATSTPRAVAASALTTIGAFATLALSEHPGTASMGVLLAVSVTAAAAMAFALAPAIARVTSGAGAPMEPGGRPPKSLADQTHPQDGDRR